MGRTAISSHLLFFATPASILTLGFHFPKNRLSWDRRKQTWPEGALELSFVEKPSPELWASRGSVFAFELPPGNRWALLWSKKSFVTDGELLVSAGECPNLVLSHSTNNGHTFSFLAHLNLIMCIPQLYRVFLFTAFCNTQLALTVHTHHHSLHLIYLHTHTQLLTE